MKLSAASPYLACVLFLGALATLTACASMGPALPTATPEELASQEVRLGVRTLTADGHFEMLPSSVVAQRLDSRVGAQPLSILALSGGGATGAFAAGALAGMTRSQIRAQFAVVTGVSAGALVAPFAFLGPEWDAEMSAIYTEGVTPRLLQRRVLFQYAASCAAVGRLWIRAAQDGAVQPAEHAVASAGAMCPADDRFIERFAALDR